LKGHLAFAFALTLALLVAAFFLLPIVMGDCVSEATRASCLTDKRHECFLYIGLAGLLLVGAVAEHLRKGRLVFPFLALLMVGPIGAVIILNLLF